MITDCPVCKKPLVNIPGTPYATCPHPHCRLYPRVPRQRKPPKPHKHAGLPIATFSEQIRVRVTPGKKRRCRSAYCVEGRDGIWIAPLWHRPDDERIACRFGNCRVVLVRFNEETMQ
jgi:hypothetical protein